MGLKKYALSDVCTIVPGFAFKSNDFGSGENIAVKIKDIEPPSVNIKNAERVCFTPQDKFRLSEGDYIMAMTGATIGKVGKLQIDAKNVYINQRVCKFNPITSVCDKEYLYYVLSTSSFRNFIYNNVDSKLAQPNIGHTTIYKYTHLFPSNIKEQKLIASVLNNIDRKIELNKQINDNLEAMAKQLYDYWFVQFDFPNEEGKPYKSSGGAMVWNEKLKRELPKGWDFCFLENLLIIKNGRDHKHLADGIYPVYGSGGEMRKASEYLYDGESVLMPRKGSLNNIMYVNEAFWTVDTMFYSEIKQSNCAKYIYYTIKDIDFTRWDSGTGVPSMTSSTLYSIKLVKPQSEILKKFDEVISPLFEHMKQISEQNSVLTKQRDELLPLLMNGQASVNSD